MDILVIVGAIAAIIGIVAGIVQVLDYLQKRRESRRESQREIEAKPADHVSPAPYNIAATRNLLRDAFTADEFRRFCRDRPLFEPLLSRFGPDASLEDMIEVAIEYCQKRLLLSELLTELKALNPRQWEKHRSLIYQHDGPIESRIPENLDPRSEFFVGREAEKAEVHEALRRSRLVCIEGIGGIGKTALALEVAHECLQASRDSGKATDVATFAGFIWVSAKDRDLGLDDLLNAVARTLRDRGIAQKLPDEKRDEVCDLFRAESYLLIVDNYDSITDEDVRDFLIKLPEPSKALITSRERKWTEAQAIPLSDLSSAESLKLMRRIGHRLKLVAVEQAHDQKLWPLYEATGGLPLAIKWAIGQIGQQGQSLDRVVDALTSVKPEIFEGIFAQSWSLLTTDAQRVLIVMPLFATPASREAIEAASNVNHFELDNALGKLVEMSLVDAMDEPDLSQRRYSMHPLTRAYAWEKLRNHHPSVRHGASMRMIQYFYQFCRERAADIGDNYDQLEEELPNISVVVELAYQLQEWATIIELLDVISDFLDHRGYWQQRVDLSEKAMEAATSHRDYHAQSWISIYHRGWVLMLQGDFEDARVKIEQGLALAKERHYASQVALALRNLGVIALEDRHFDEARKKCEESLMWWAKAGPTASKMNPHRGEAMTLGTIGNIAWELGDYEQARQHYLKQKAVYEKLDDPYSLSVVYANLALCAVRLGQPDEAVESCQRALEEFEQAGRTDGAGYLLWLLQQPTQHKGSFPRRRRWLLDRNKTFEQYGTEPDEVLLKYSRLAEKARKGEN